MAKIFGFEMKNVKKTYGREGEGVLASLYLNGKKIGTYEDYGDGAMGNDDYSSKEDKLNMMKTIIEFAKTHPNSYIVDLYKNNPTRYEEEVARFKKFYPSIPDEDITIETMSANNICYIVEEFLLLNNLEKTFKRNVKKGYKAIGVKFMDELKCNYTISSYPSSWSDEKIIACAKKDGETLYMSLDDFVA